MKVKELLETLKQYNVPDDAEIFVWAYNGDDGEPIRSINISRSKNKKSYEEMVFEFGEYEDIYDENELKHYDKNGEITAVCLYGDM